MAGDGPFVAACGPIPMATNGGSSTSGGRSPISRPSCTWQPAVARDGIPTIKIGNCLRIPRPGLLTLAFTGRVVSPAELESYVSDLLNRSNRPTQ